MMLNPTLNHAHGPLAPTCDRCGRPLEDGGETLANPTFPQTSSSPAEYDVLTVCTQCYCDMTTLLEPDPDTTGP